MINTQDIQLSLAGSSILNGISIKIPKGKVTALIGPNGAGKSTLLHIISRLQKQSSGKVYLNKRDIQDFSYNELAKHLSILRQESRIGSRLRVKDLVAFGRYPHTKGRISHDDKIIITEAIADFDLNALAERFLDTLSGGQKQRALLAMNFAQDTDTVLLDEPLNNLDLSHARRLMQIIRSHADKGRTFVLVLHDLNYAAQYADYIIAMKQGNVFATDNTSTIFNSKILSELYDTPIEIVDINDRPMALSY